MLGLGAAARVFVDHLSDFGLATLFFVAGSEINFEAVRGRPIVRASLGWLTSLVIGLAVGVLIAPGETAVIIAVALSSTALGTLMPILRDAGELHTPFGRAATAIGAVGEFGPLVAISLFLGTREPGISTLVLVGFVVRDGRRDRRSRRGCRTGACTASCAPRCTPPGSSPCASSS